MARITKEEAMSGATAMHRIRCATLTGMTCVDISMALGIEESRRKDEIAFDVKPTQLVPVNGSRETRR